jgi:hypothetical protein
VAIMLTQVAFNSPAPVPWIRDFWLYAATERVFHDLA